MSLTIKIRRNFYGTYNLFTKPIMTFMEGFTVLVGCNGSGKSTVLKHIQSICKNSRKNPDSYVISYDNFHDGGLNMRSALEFYEDFGSLIERVESSEGEEIYRNMEFVIDEIVKIKQSNIFSQIKNIFVLIDAIDSGLSIDNIIDIKDFWKNVVIRDFEKNFPDKNLYIITVANEYEMANGENCFDVRHCRYVTFENYEKYKMFIMNSRKEKDKIRNAYLNRIESKKKSFKLEEDNENEQIKWDPHQIKSKRKPVHIQDIISIQ